MEKNILTINSDDWDSEYHDLYIHKTGNNVNEKKETSVFSVKELRSYIQKQGGRTWQAFGGGKHGHETFRQARNYNFRDKCVVFARNLKFSNLTQ